MIYIIALLILIIVFAIPEARELLMGILTFALFIGLFIIGVTMVAAIIILIKTA
jgi:hypothetical protein